ncbi:MAG: class I SAM-dependent methyltransferase [Pseudomonadota bacterium]
MRALDDTSAEGTLEHLDSQREIWESKPVIRALYGHYHALMADHAAEGFFVEIGTGCGNLKETRDDVVSVDIVRSGWVDLVANAEQLPFANAAVDNLVMLDVLHHVQRPLLFLQECQRTLRPGGRLVMLEPGITPLSKIFYDRFHPEPVIMDADVTGDERQSGDDPFDSNQAIPTLLFGGARQQWQETTPHLSLRHREWLGPFSYPMSGGFRPWRALTPSLLRPLLWSEEKLLPEWLKRLIAFRLLIVIERLGEP